MELFDLIDAGCSDREIAGRLGVSPNAVFIARKRYGVPSRTARLLSAEAVARQVGVSCAKTVARWIRQGWLRGRRGQPRGANRQWYVRPEDLRDFLRDPAHWHRWEPERIPDPSLRAWAQEVRGGVRYLSQTEVARRCCVQRATVQQWIDTGLLPAVSTGSHRLVRESDLAAFRPPKLGFDRERFEREMAEGTLTRSVCQAVTSRGQACGLTARHKIAGVRLCNKHRAVLDRRGGVRVRREVGGPIEALVDMPGGHRLYPVESSGVPA
jgi:excisionase family DNA binding protein